jgi:hypothetical protein
VADPFVHFIVFSKDRPLQLHGMLTSVFRHWRGDFTVDVLYRGEPAYERAYSEVAREFAGRVLFWGEQDFASDLKDILDYADDGHPYTCFGCDDVVYTLPVEVEDFDRAFSTEPRLLGLSLRLGKHTELDMFGRPMPQPAFSLPTLCFEEYAWEGIEHRLQWGATAGAGDWGYPWEVLGTVYPTDYVRATVRALVNDGQVQNPSTLEDAGWRRWREHAGERHLMQSFASSRLVVPTVNLVQSVFGNGIVGPAGLDPSFLLDCWNRGLRLDVDRYRGATPPSWRVGDFFLRRAA